MLVHVHLLRGPMNGSNLSSQKHAISPWLTPGARVKCGIHLEIVLTCDRYMSGTSPSCPVRIIQTVEASVKSHSLNLARVAKERKGLCPTLQATYAILTSRTPQPTATSKSRSHRLPPEGSVRSPVPAVSKRTLCWNVNMIPRSRSVVPESAERAPGGWSRPCTRAPI